MGRQIRTRMTWEYEHRRREEGRCMRCGELLTANDEVAGVISCEACRLHQRALYAERKIAKQPEKAVPYVTPQDVIHDGRNELVRVWHEPESLYAYTERAAKARDGRW